MEAETMSLPATEETFTTGSYGIHGNPLVNLKLRLTRAPRADAAAETRAVDVHIGRLRAKLGTAGRQIETVVGLGYRFIE